MASTQTKATHKPGEPGKVSFMEGRGELPMLEVTTQWSAAEIYLHGAHVTHFRRKNEPPLLFLSQCSRFDENHPIRGGIPVIFPWFGPREGMGQHGFVRVKAWELKECVTAPDGSVSVRFQLPDYPESSSFPPCSVDYLVTVNECLTLELTVVNKSADIFSFENCLHTYFDTPDISRVSVKGLKGATYLDKVNNYEPKTEANEEIRFSSEVDRVYLNTTGTVDIIDESLGRRIRVEKHGSVSTVVWNPWSTKAQQMPDFGNEEYLRMLCVESGNVGSNSIKLPPNEKSTLTVKLSSSKL